MFTCDTMETRATIYILNLNMFSYSILMEIYSEETLDDQSLDDYEVKDDRRKSDLPNLTSR